MKQNECKENKKNVIIIGGGMAGIKLAYELKNAGINYQLLEYSDYLGGRIKSTNMPRYAPYRMDYTTTSIKEVLCGARRAQTVPMGGDFLEPIPHPGTGPLQK